ncbi:flavin dependent monooxygenase-like protein [Hyaloscypha bicolor E]|uniref:Flavin dependent monooxygenase-like protein n=1 Tax=Hyaloscypha bicolor E TaxID=1095630 RepID=A0A2J6SN31_9HELO|nr:flavin dependent monooxygenase-like protein [Hyaloscypha bicolor E]PMD52120.1 flavin dependent monooxygenase-like protein [Hyaloscypha bicolor E]
MAPIKSIAIIGAGPAGAICIDALAQEQEFDTIRVFERREKAGGCWIEDPEAHVQQLPNFEKLAARTPDETLPIPSKLPAVTPHNTQYRYSETSIYPTLETNIDAFAMSFSQEPFPEERTPLNIQRHGVNSPFRHWKTVERYLQDLLNRHGYQGWVSYNTTVELVHKDKETGKWILTLRQPLEHGKEDKWWTETFDAVVVAAGHYTVPYIPLTPGLAELAQDFPGSVEHSKAWRNPEKYRNKRTVTVGASISGPDIAYALADVAETPLHCVVRGKYHPYFFDFAFQHPNILRRPPITHIISNRETDERTIFFEDGTKLEKVDHIIFGTGYTWTMPFFPKLAKTIRNNRLPNLYQHVFWQEDPTLCFVGAISAGFTFKIFEWQAVLAARFLAGRITLPPLSEQIKWEEDRIAYKGDGVPFTALYPDFEEYFEELRAMAGEPTDGKGRPLPKFCKWWRQGFDSAHLSRIAMWKRGNEEARERTRREKEGVSVKDGFLKPASEPSSLPIVGDLV